MGRSLESLKISLGSSFRTAAKYIAPPLHKKICENKARFHYAKSQSPENAYKGAFGKTINGIVARGFLKEAGHDVSNDDAFVNVLSIPGGRAQFMEETELPDDEPNTAPGADL